MCFCIARVSCEIWNWKYVHIYIILNIHIRIYFLMKAHHFFFFILHAATLQVMRGDNIFVEGKRHMCALRVVHVHHIFILILLYWAWAHGVLVYVMKILLADARATTRRRRWSNKILLKSCWCYAFFFHSIYLRLNYIFFCYI